jgi:hypothetical protein
MDDADVILEVPAEWFDNPLDRDRHQRLYASLLVALAELSVTVRPIRLPYAADGAERLHAHGQLVISFHSHGDEGNVLRFKESYVPPYYTADPMGYSGFSKLATEPEHFRHDIERVPLKAAETFVADLRETLVRRNASKYAQPTAEAELPRGPYVFVPLQTIEDPVAGFAHIDQIDALAVISAKARARGWSVVAKRHPLCTARRIEAGLEELSRDYGNLHLSTGSIHPLIAGAEAVVGCNSGVLFELWCMTSRWSPMAARISASRPGKQRPTRNSHGRSTGSTPWGPRSGRGSWRGISPPIASTRATSPPSGAGSPRCWRPSTSGVMGSTRSNSTSTITMRPSNAPGVTKS